jgi:DNA-binding CsgD family transcriptional regulator/tetratricopeptide (TPR) repeat protein
MSNGRPGGTRSATTSPVLVGRDSELRLLDGALAGTREGSPATVLLGGEAGVGKSRLVEEFGGRVTGQARLLVGGCLELGESGLPFAPFTAVLRELVREHGADHILGLLPGNDAGELGRLLPAFGPPAGENHGGLARARLFEQLLTLLQGLAEATLVVLVVEDVHWADRSTLDLLSFIVRNQQSAQGLLCIVTYRSDRLDSAHPLRPLLADLARLPTVRLLELGRLGRSCVTAQLRSLLGHEPAAGLSDSIYRRSEGNPLFVEALLASGGGSGDPPPHSIRDLLAGPLYRLSERTQHVVRTAAAGGALVDHALLTAVTGLSDPVLSRALRPAVSSNLLLVDEDAYRFRHALIREVVYADLLPGERTRLHVRYAEALERDQSLAPPGRAAVEVAHHWYAVAKQHATRALRAAWRAAAESDRSLAYAEQLHMLTQVLDLWERVPDAAAQLGTGRQAVLEEAIRAALLAGEGDRAMSLIMIALAEIDPQADPARAGRILQQRGELRYALGLPGDIDDLRDAARLIPPGNPARASALNSLATRLLTIPSEDEGRMVAEHAMREARAAGDATAEITAAINVAYALARAGDVTAQLPTFAQARLAAERLGDHDTLMHCYRCEADVLQGAGQYVQAAEAARRGLAVAGQAGLLRTFGPTQAGNLAEALVALGDWDEAIETIEHAIEFAPTPSLHAYLLVLRGSVGLARGDTALAEAATNYARVVFTRGTTYAQDLLLLLHLEVELLTAQDRPAAAVTLVQRALADATTSSNPRYLWPFIAAAAGAATAEPGPLLAHLHALAARVPIIGAVQRAHQLTFVAETTPSSYPAWDRCAAAWQDLRQPYPHAQALLRAAIAAAEEGDTQAAAKRLCVAAENADQLAARPLRTRIDRLARLIRIPVVPETSDADSTAPAEQPNEQSRRRFGLTPRELEVLRLVADGRSNRQIAEELFISAKTASVHVSNILAKLGVPSRIQAAAVAHRIGLFNHVQAVL